MEIALVQSAGICGFFIPSEAVRAVFGGSSHRAADAGMITDLASIMSGASSRSIKICASVSKTSFSNEFPKGYADYY